MTAAGTINEDTFFDHWELAKAALKVGSKMPPITDGKPQGGCYRTREIKDGPWLPVYIYIEDGAIVCRLNDEVATHKINRIWNSCAKHPIEWDAYEARIDTGAWPGEAAPTERAAEIGDNAPPATEDPIDVLLGKRIDDAAVWISKTPIDSEEASEEAANRVGELRALKAKAVAAHEIEKAPHLKAGRAVDERYQPLIKTGGRADAAVKYILGKMNAFVDAQKEKARKTEQEEKDRLAAIEAVTQKATDAARNAVAEHGAGLREPTAPVPPVAPPPTPPAKASFGGVTGRKISQQTKTVAVIEDQDKCYQHFRDNPAVQQCLQDLAQKRVNIQQPVPGVTTREETVMK